MADNIETSESEVNFGFKKNLERIQQRKQDERAQRDSERAQRESSPFGARLTRLKMQADTPYGVKFLHSYDKRIELAMHLWKGDQPCHELCWEMYDEPCEICKMVNTRFGSECYPLEVACMLGYVYNLVGATFDKELNGETKKFAMNPIKLVEIPLGKESVNVNAFSDGARLGFFQKEIWLIERKKGTGFVPPKTVEGEIFKRLIGATKNDFSLDLPEKSKTIGTLSKKELFKLVISAFENVQYDKLLGVEVPASGPTILDDPELQPAGSPIIKSASEFLS